MPREAEGRLPTGGEPRSPAKPGRRARDPRSVGLAREARPLPLMPLRPEGRQRVAAWMLEVGADPQGSPPSLRLGSVGAAVEWGRPRRPLLSGLCPAVLSEAGRGSNCCASTP